MKDDFEALYRDFIKETLGDGQISYIYDDFVDGAWQFAEYLKNIQGLSENTKCPRCGSELVRHDHEFLDSCATCEYMWLKLTKENRGLQGSVSDV